MYTLKRVRIVRISCLRYYLHYLSIPLYTQLIRTLRTLFEAYIVCFLNIILTQFVGGILEKFLLKLSQKKILCWSLGKLQKKVLLLAGPLRPNPLPPSSLMAVEILERWKKVFFSLMARPLREELFFCCFPKKSNIKVTLRNKKRNASTRCYLHYKNPLASLGLLCDLK